MDLSVFDPILALCDELTDNLRDIVSPAVPPAAATTRDTRPPAPPAAAELLRRVYHQHESVLAALEAAKPRPDVRIKDILRAAAAPLPELDVTAGSLEPTTTAKATPKVKARPKGKPGR